MQLACWYVHEHWTIVYIFFLQVNFTCTLKEFGQRCRNARLLNVTKDAYSKTRFAINGHAGTSPSCPPCTWVAHLEMSHKLTNEQCETLSSNITALTSTNICWHGMWRIYYHNYLWLQDLFYHFVCNALDKCIYMSSYEISLLTRDHDIVTVLLQLTSIRTFSGGMATNVNHQ